MATVTMTPEAAGQYDELPRTIKVRVAGIFDRLKDWPNVSGAKALTGNLAGCYRMRTGDYRVQFRVSDGNVIVERVGHRDGFYED